MIPINKHINITIKQIVFFVILITLSYTHAYIFVIENSLYQTIYNVNGLLSQKGKLPLGISLLQHVFDKDSVASLWRIDQHVRHRPNDLSVLQNGGSTHALNNASRAPKKLWIRNL